MLKYPIKYKDFSDRQVTEDFYFNLSTPELIEMEVDAEGGSLADFLRKIIAAESGREIIQQFKKIILTAYGERSPDGKRFVKNDDLREGFLQSAAYPVLFMELSTDSEKAANFIKGIMPPEMAAEVEKAEAEAAAQANQ